MKEPTMARKKQDILDRALSLCASTAEWTAEDVTEARAALTGLREQARPKHLPVLAQGTVLVQQHDSFSSMGRRSSYVCLDDRGRQVCPEAPAVSSGCPDFDKILGVDLHEGAEFELSLKLYKKGRRQRNPWRKD